VLYENAPIKYKEGLFQHYYRELMGAESLHCRCCNTNVDISKVIAAREKNKKNTAKIRRKSK